MAERVWINRGLLLIAAACFLLAAFGIGGLGPVALVPLGLCFFAAAHLG